MTQNVKAIMFNRAHGMTQAGNTISHYDDTWTDDPQFWEQPGNI